MNLPEHLEGVRVAAKRALQPIRPAGETTAAPKNLLFSSQRTDAGRGLPPYYLVYFLLVDLLEFRNLGRFEKLAWSVPIDYNGKAFLIEHRKFGLGIFVEDPAAHEKAAAEVAVRIHKAVKVARPYFEWRAETAVAESKLNVKNHTNELGERFKYFLSEYKSVVDSIRSEEGRRKDLSPEEWMSGCNTFSSEPYMLTERATWLAGAVIDAFFSFTEHVFIHLAILQGKIATGNEVASLAGADWATKFKAVFDLKDSTAKRFYDDLTEIRRQHRNFVAHGSFGKQGEAFTFHSGAGAAPVLLPHMRGTQKFALTGPLTVEDPEAIKTILSFMEFLWADEREPARIYLQRTSLPVIMTMAADGTYARAMQSCEEMESLAEHLVGEWDRSANMDW
ncbi:hypothetical protein GO608_000360 (plasmid) [Aromatoleum buckelii]|nr:hypothetical protein [Aromatoleum buckelii]